MEGALKALLLAAGIAYMAANGGGLEAAQAIDGDTLLLGQERIRVMGVDTPEMAARCPRESEAALAAKRRTAALIAAGISLERHGVDKYRRTLARVVLPDGRDLGETLVAEGLARRWTGRREGWCG